jgi:hypothetical protein
MITIAGTMITIAGGIILAVLFFVFLPQIIRLASAVFAFALILGGLALVAVLLDPASAVVLAIVAGVTLIYAYVPLKDFDQPAKPRPRARIQASD